MRRILLAGFLLGTMALGAPPAHATTITQYGSGGPAGHDTFDVVFQQAHLAPGDVLNSVTLVIAGFAWATAYIEPDESFPVWAFVHASVGVTVNGPGIPYKPPYTWPDFDLLGTVIPVDGIATTSLYNGSASLGPVDRSPTLDHAAYVGPGTVSIAVSVSEDSDVCDVFGGSILCNMGLNWTVALVYDITEVPEPSALLIVSGAGMVSIASGRRARSCRRLNAV